jgi:hypothetical protein
MHDIENNLRQISSKVINNMNDGTCESKKKYRMVSSVGGTSTLDGRRLVPVRLLTLKIITTMDNNIPCENQEDAHLSNTSVQDVSAKCYQVSRRLTQQEYTAGRTKRERRNAGSQREKTALLKSHA